MSPLLHRAFGLLLLPLLVWLSWSGTLSLYRSELDHQLAPALSQQQLPAVLPALSEQFAKALSYQQAQMPEAATLYVEFASARKPFISLHLRAPGSWQLQHSYLALSDGAPLGPLQLVRPGPSAQSAGSWFFSLHYQLLGLLGRHGQTLALVVAFAALWLSLAGVWLCWRRWRAERRLGGQLERQTSRETGQDALQWHQWGGLLVLPWLCWFFGSALFTQFGQWHSSLIEYSQVSSGQYYGALFPQPLASEAAIGAVASNKPAATAEPAMLVSMANSILQQAAWPVGKLQLDYQNQRFLLTQHSASQLQSVGAQLQQQSYTLDGAVLAQAPYSESPVWQLRNWFYALHQAAFAQPWLRACLFGFGCLTVLMLLASVELIGQRLKALWLLRTLTSGFVLASVLSLLAQWLWPLGLSFSALFGGAWLLATLVCHPRCCSARAGMIKQRR